MQLNNGAHTMQTREGDRFRTSQAVRALCQIMMTKPSVYRGSEASFHTDFKATIPPGRLFTVDAVNGDDIYCDLDDQDNLEVELIPPQLREGVTFAEYAGCQIIINRGVLLEACECIGHETEDDDSPAAVDV
jgi:hypothetical protein